VWVCAVRSQHHSADTSSILVSFSVVVPSLIVDVWAMTVHCFPQQVAPPLRSISKEQAKEIEAEALRAGGG
jgi:hypothetical protein